MKYYFSSLNTFKESWMQRTAAGNVTNDLSRILLEKNGYKDIHMVTHHGNDAGVLVPLRIWKKLESSYKNLQERKEI